MRKRSSGIVALVAAAFVVLSASDCGVQQAVDSAIQQGINQAAGQFGGIDLQGFANSYLSGQ